MIIKAGGCSARIFAVGLFALFASPVTAADTSASQSEITNAGNKVVLAASDQLSDSDRTLQESRPNGAAATSAPSPGTAAAMRNESSIWDHTSLVGKIFIGVGALLTMASAARMFIS